MKTKLIDIQKIELESANFNADNYAYVANSDIRLRRYEDGIAVDAYRCSQSCIVDEEQNVVTVDTDFNFPTHLLETQTCEEIACELGFTVKITVNGDDEYRAYYFKPVDDDEWNVTVWNKKIRTMSQLKTAINERGYLEADDIEDAWELDGIFAPALNPQPYRGYFYEEIILWGVTFFWLHHCSLDSRNYDHDCYLLPDMAAVETWVNEWTNDAFESLVDEWL
jgi:hypothetical protein